MYTAYIEVMIRGRKDKKTNYLYLSEDDTVTLYKKNAISHIYMDKAFDDAIKIMSKVPNFHRSFELITIGISAL